MRDDVMMISVIQIALAVGLVLGMGYLIPDISEASALFLVTGAATQSFVTMGLVMLPQMLSQSKAEGRIEYFLTMPISREAYLLSLITVVAITSLPGVAFTLAFGAWHYGLTLSLEPAFFRLTAEWRQRAASADLERILLADGMRAKVVERPLLLLYRHPAFQAQYRGRYRVADGCPIAREQVAKRFAVVEGR